MGPTCNTHVYGHCVTHLLYIDHTAFQVIPCSSRQYARFCTQLRRRAIDAVVDDDESRSAACEVTRWWRFDENERLDWSAQHDSIAAIVSIRVVTVVRCAAHECFAASLCVGTVAPGDCACAFVYDVDFQTEACTSSGTLLIGMLE